MHLLYFFTILLFWFRAILGHTTNSSQPVTVEIKFDSLEATGVLNFITVQPPTQSALPQEVTNTTTNADQTTRNLTGTQETRMFHSGNLSLVLPSRTIPRISAIPTLNISKAINTTSSSTASILTSGSSHERSGLIRWIEYILFINH